MISYSMTPPLFQIGLAQIMDLGSQNPEIFRPPPAAEKKWRFWSVWGGGHPVLGESQPVFEGGHPVFGESQPVFGGGHPVLVAEGSRIFVTF